MKEKLCKHISICVYTLCIWEYFVSADYGKEEIMLNRSKPIVVQEKKVSKLNRNKPINMGLYRGFDFAPFVGKKVLRASLNTYRIHIWNFFMPDMRLDCLQQELIESGELKPKITPDGDSELCEKAAYLKQFISRVVFTPASSFYLVCFLNTPDSETLGKVMDYLKEFGIKVKLEVAHKDELKGV